MQSTLRDQMLYLEARVAMLEDKLDVLRQNLRAWGRCAVSLVEIATVYVAALILGDYLEKRKP